MCVRIHAIRRANQVEYVTRILTATLQEYVRRETGHTHNKNTRTHDTTRTTHRNT